MTQPAVFKLRLYIAGGALDSALAAANLNSICRAHLPDRHDIEIIDVFRDPKRAYEDHIYTTPTLLKLTPLPVRRLVGTLNQTPFVLNVLGVKPLPTVNEITEP
jgi:circadian clock protein KaiB